MKIHGIIPPLVTPLNSDGSIDFESTEKLIEHVIEGGIHGVFILGTTGEGPSLSYEIRRQFIEFVTDKVSKRIPVVVSISDTSLAESVSLADYAHKAGADAVAFTPPYYFVPGTPELIDFVHDLGGRIQLPFFLYNMPALTKVTLPLEVVEAGFQMSNCLGLKDSSGDLFYYKKVRRLIGNRDLTLLIGPEELLAESLLAGGHGGINGGANIFPEIYVSIYELMQAGKIEEAEELQREVLEISASLFTLGKHGSSIIKGIKAGLEVLGITKRNMAAPFRGFNEAEFEQVRSAITDLEARKVVGRKFSISAD